jgi:DNA (cytosine-5)-methyltransferase 1
VSDRRLLDLFCGAGGAGEGYRRAGFYVVGVDSTPHVYPAGEFLQADALDVLADRDFLAGFDVIHASPPCPRYSSITAAGSRDGHPDLVEPVRELLRAWGGAYVVENVPGAPLENPLQLCGSEFALSAGCRDGIRRQLRRHRLFESNVWLMGAGGCQHRGPVVGVYGECGGTPEQMLGITSKRNRGYKGTRAEAREAMGIDWMGVADLSDAIPPAYTEHIGWQLLDHLARTAGGSE